MKKQAYLKIDIRPLSKNIPLKSFTLTELLMVIIILAILATLALPTFRKAVIHSRDKEARSMLSLIAQSEEMYKLESGGSYVGCSDTNDCNNKLTLSINNGTSAFWSYKVTVPDNKSSFCARADSIAAHLPTARFFTIGNGDEEPNKVNEKGNCE